MDTRKSVELTELVVDEGAKASEVKGGFFWIFSAPSSVRSQAEQRQDTQRKDITRNIAG
jgi:hypothetical protein